MAHAQRKRVGEWVWQYKSTHACQRCGESHPATIEFHHRNPDEKELSISGAIANGWSIARLLTEIEKCDTLCRNCHAKVHYEWRNNDHSSSYSTTQV